MISQSAVTTESQFDGDSGGALWVEADADKTLDADTLDVGITAIGGPIVTADAIATALTDASIGAAGSDGGVNVSGNLHVNANAVEHLTARNRGGASGGVTSGDMTGQALSSGDVTATLDDGSNVQARRVEVKASADRQSESGKNTDVATVGAISVSLVKNTAEVSGDVEARIGDGATVDANRGVFLLADSISNVSAAARGGAGGAVNASDFLAIARLVGSTNARVGNDVRLDARRLTVEAESNKTVDSRTSRPA